MPKLTKKLAKARIKKYGKNTISRRIMILCDAKYDKIGDRISRAKVLRAGVRKGLKPTTLAYQWQIWKTAKGL